MYSMVLTGIAFYKTEYQHMFATVPPGVHEMIDKFQNCEDIAFNVMVADHLNKSGTPQCPGVYVEPADLQWVEKLAGVYLKYLYHVCIAIMCSSTKERQYKWLLRWWSTSSPTQIIDFIIKLLTYRYTTAVLEYKRCI